MNRLTVFDPVTGVTRTIESREASLLAFLAASDGHTLVLGRLALCEDDVERAWPLRSASSSERVRKPARPGARRAPHAAAEPGPAPSTTEET